MYRLLYKSLAAKNLNPVELEILISSCRENNELNMITGLLLFDGETFCQLIEGDRHNVMHVMEKIQKDDRHRRVRILGQRPAEVRAYMSWGFHRDVENFYDELQDALNFNG
ncbi:MAG: BLUF domain-containing protein [Rhizobiaceae bacterium]|nr:BLUF domain-containing protein [Rhizobiaceae bacterium]